MKKYNKQATISDVNESTRQFVRLLAKLVVDKLKENDHKKVTGTPHHLNNKSRPTKFRAKTGQDPC